MFYVYADLCSLLAATSQFSILIGQNMQLTGCHNGNEMRNATCADTQISIEWPYCSLLYCDNAPLRPILNLTKLHTFNEYYTKVLVLSTPNLHNKSARTISIPEQELLGLIMITHGEFLCTVLKLEKRHTFKRREQFLIKLYKINKGKAM